MSTLLKTIRAKLMFAMGALAVIAAGLALYGIYEAHNLNQEIEFMTGTVTHRMIYLGRANEAFLDYYRFQKNHLLEADPVAKQKWEKEQVGAEARLNQALANWENVASDLEKQKITIIREAFDDFKEANARILVLSKSSQLAKAREVSNGAAHQAYQRADKALGEATELAENAMRNQADEAAATYARTRRLMVIITIVAVGGCCSLSFLLVGRVVKRFDLVLDRIKDVAQGDGDLTKRVEVHTDDELGQLGRWFNTFMDKLQRIILQLAQSTEHIASAAEELSSTATQTSRSTATQKDQTTQVAAAMQQMSSTMVQVSENATRASENARRGGQTARSGGVIVEETIEVIQNLAASTRDTAAKIQELGKSSDQIGQIIGVIDDIADQTNLLALNAAIEAARAGEQGRGFAVVADEVRKLAERTMHATKEIAQMIKTIQSETQHAVEAMQSGTVAVERGVETATKAGASLNEIIQASELVNDMITQIATAATEQSAATQQVRSNMDQIASLVQESSVGAEQSAKACVDLSDLALDLQQLVARFKLGEDSQAPAGSIRPSSPRGLEPEMHPLPGLPRQTRVTVQ